MAVDALELYNGTPSIIIPRETVRRSCYVSTPKQMFLALMSGERVCFKEYNKAAKYYIRATEIFRSIYKPDMTDYDFVLGLNNYIVEHIAYDYSVINKPILDSLDMESFEIDAPLFRGVGVCSAKSKLFSLLCCLANIKTVMVVGRINNSERDILHAWNKVYLAKPYEPEARWWNIDTTNNHTHRRLDILSRDYFLVSDDRITCTHSFINPAPTHEYKQINYLSTGSFEYPIS